MFGNNAVAKARKTNDFLVSELWYTIQGEGPWIGRPAIFVRLAGCNLRCSFCDTDFESVQQHYSLTELTTAILGMAVETGCRRVVITGGEPMLQQIGALMYQETGNTLWYDLKFQIETAGTVWPESLYKLPTHTPPLIVCSPKTPKIHDSVAEACWHFKYIIQHDQLDPLDGLPVGLFRPSIVKWKQIFVQPCDTPDPEVNALNMQAAVASAMRYNYRLSVQLHKIIGVR